MVAINPKFIDVDFSTIPDFVAGDHGAPVFADQPLRAYAEIVPTIPEAQWRPLAEKMAAEGGGSSRLVTRIMNQKNEGSCVGHAGTQAHQIVQAKQFGRDKVTQLSAISMYQLIGRSPNSGANVGDCIEEMARVGIVPLDTPENRARFGENVMPPTGFHSKRPPGAAEVAKQFQAIEWAIIRNFAELITALLNQDPVVVGRSGHSIVYCDPIYRGNDLLTMYCNSYGEDFGDGGFGYDSMRLIRSSASYAFALRSVTVPSFQTAA